MITEILVLVAYLVENCTGVALIETSENTSVQSTDSQELFLISESPSPLHDFTQFDPDDTIFEEYDPPQHLEADPKAWKQSLPTFNKSFWECLKTVLIIQTVAGTLIGMVAVGLVLLDFNSASWCKDPTQGWNEQPMSVQRLRVVAQCVEGFAVQFWDLILLCAIFPISLIKKLNLVLLYVITAFADVIYLLNLQMLYIFNISWNSYPLNILFICTILFSHFLLARYFNPQSSTSTLRVHFILTAQYILGFPMAYFLVYKFISFYVRQEEHIKVFLSATAPLVTAIPKVISRLGAQRLKGIIHPGTAHVLVVLLYGVSAVLFRVLQAELTSIGLFVALGIAHAITDLLERITITMRDYIWEYLYRLVRRPRTRQPKYRSPRSRRFMADVSIQIMMQETSALITALGFTSVYQAMYSQPKPFISYELVGDFLMRASIGLSIDLFFNTLSLLIQTRVMNVAVNRVWKKKWRHHIFVNCVVIWISVLYYSGHLFDVVKDKYNSVKHPNHYTYNCSFSIFL